MPRGILLLLFLIGLYPAAPHPGQATMQPQPHLATPVRNADAACAKCHEKIYLSYLQTPMANGSGLAAKRLVPGEYDHTLAQVDYKLENVNGKAVLAWNNLRDPGASGHYNLTYFLGSGHLGTTWLYSVNHYWFESPVAWYSATHRYDMKPGLAKSTSMLPALPMQSECMRCHMSDVQPSAPGTTNRYSGQPFLHGGITCESCHGDTSQHLLSKGKIPVVDPAKLTPEKRDSICISCHLEGDVTVDRAGHSILNYKPGQSISTYLAYYIYAKSDPLARGVSEVEQFNQSMCKRMSGDKMSCTTCHDPHYTPPVSQQAAFYRSKCLTCHNAPSFIKTHHPDNPDCIGCHMPHSGAQNIPHVAWTDHRILARPQEDTASQSVATNVLKPIFSPGANQRDLGMAYYMAYLKGNAVEGDQAYKLLSSQQQAIQNDKNALDALGLLSVGRGDYAAGQKDFQRALALDPVDLTAQSNLGILLAKLGLLTESLQMLENAFHRNPDVVGLAEDLARVQCATGDVAGVRATLRTALIYNPGMEAMQQFIKAAGSCRITSQPGAGQ